MFIFSVPKTNTILGITMVEGEINNFIMVWTLVFISVSYCFAMTKIIPKGILRLVTFMPIICLFFFVPFKLNTIHMGCPTVFSITWLANFKILLLAYGNGPLSNPSLSMFHFGVFACFPLVAQINRNSKNKKQNKNEPMKQNLSLLSCAKTALTMIFLLYVAFYKDYVPKKVFLFLVCTYIIVSLELLLTTTAVIAEFVSGLKLEPPFNQPYLSTSLKDFWGRRWNRVATTILRAAVFDPIVLHAPPYFNRSLVLCLGLFGTFLVSGVMHEILHYFLSRGKNGGGTVSFFIFHGVLLAVESVFKRRLKIKWRLPKMIIGPIIYGFVIYTFMIFALPDLMECDVYDRAIQEWRAFGAFFRGMAL